MLHPALAGRLFELDLRPLPLGHRLRWRLVVALLLGFPAPRPDVFQEIAAGHP
jgi:hypothetical protein